MRLVWFACLTALLLAANAPEPLTVSAAISLTDALQPIADAYARAGRGAVRFNFAGSNVLARQLANGAPADLFISADEAQMAIAAGAGAIDTTSHQSPRKPPGGHRPPGPVDDVDNSAARGPAPARGEAPGRGRPGCRPGRCVRQAMARSGGGLAAPRVESGSGRERSRRAGGGRGWGGRGGHCLRDGRGAFVRCGGRL